MSEGAARAEAALATHQLEAERRAHRMRADLLRLAGHELNTPLTPLTLQVELLKSGRLGPLAPPQARAMGILDRNLGRLAELIHDVLEVTRLQEGRLPVVATPTDLAALARDAAEAFEAVAEERRVALELQATTPVMVMADPTRLAQVLTNLLSNATKFTPPGGRVTVRTEARGGEGIVRVEDTGLGFTEAQRARLFEPFSQLHPEAARTGSGLGLYICKGILARHGGRIWAESRGPGQGACFACAVPLHRATSVPPVELPPPALMPPAA